MNQHSGAADAADAPTQNDVTLRDWVEQWAFERPGERAILGDAGTIDFATLHQRALALATSLRDLGVQRGDVVAAQLPNCPEFIVTWLATGYVGAILQTIHLPYRAAEIETLLRHGKAKVAVCVARLKDFSPAELMLSLRPGLRKLRHVMAIGADPPAGVSPFPDAAASTPGKLFEPWPRADDHFLLLYTSGTMSAPKGVPITYRKFLPNAAASAHELGVTASSVLMSAAPFTHLYGLYSLNMAMAVGAATAVLPAFTPAAMAEAIDRYRPTGLFVAPAHMAACLNQGLLTAERLASLDFALISGSACPPDLAEAVQQRMPDGKVLQLWGMSELQAGSFTRPRDEARVRFGTAGRASSGTELRVMIEQARAPAGTEGELQVRGASVFDGYLDNPEATAGAFSGDGWFRTGDLATMDDAGNIAITGRSKDVINRGGVKFNPADVELLIARHPAVAECAIVPKPDPVLGERACCFVVLEPGQSALRLEELCVWLGEHGIAKNQWPEHLEILSGMPTTPTRKVMKGELMWRARELE